MPRLVYLDAAKQDLVTIAHFIKKESSSSSVAVEFTKRIRAFCRKLAAPRLVAWIGQSQYFCRFLWSEQQ